MVKIMQLCHKYNRRGLCHKYKGCICVRELRLKDQLDLDEGSL